MKIAVVTENGSTISQHFGRAPWYLVATAETGKVTSKEKRAKSGHHSTGHSCSGHCGEGGHGLDANSQAKHAGMADAISDCQVLIAGGMGMGAYESMKAHNIETIITDVESIDEAVGLYLAKKLPNLMERVH
jgi:predicted Fe-Mo cluster-binding NifX family protein